MPDITMCSGESCPRRDRCWRHTAKPDSRQSYFAKPPLTADGGCIHFWENHDEPVHIGSTWSPAQHSKREEK